MIKKNETEREEETQRILSLLRNERNKLEESIELPIVTPKQHRSNSNHLISPYWLVAASLIGYIVGFATPNDFYNTSSSDFSASIDTLAYSGYSIAQDDINTELLFTM